MVGLLVSVYVCVFESHQAFSLFVFLLAFFMNTCRQFGQWIRTISASII